MSSTRPSHPPIKLCGLVAPIIITLNFSEAINFPYWRISLLWQPVCLPASHITIHSFMWLHGELLSGKNKPYYNFQRKEEGDITNCTHCKNDRFPVFCDLQITLIQKVRVTWSWAWPPINRAQSADLNGNPSLSIYVFWMPPAPSIKA